MNHKLKGLGLMFVALLALAGFSSSAMATEFHSETAHTIISGEQAAGTNDVMTFRAGKWTCNSITYSGTASTVTTGQIRVVPTYKECTAFGFVSIPIDVAAGPNGGCAMVFTPSSSAQSLHYACGAGEFITVTAFNCWIKIGNQSFSGGITYTNAGSGSSRDITIHTNITGLTYTQENKSFPGCSNGTFSDGNLVGTSTFRGQTTEASNVGIWHG